MPFGKKKDKRTAQQIAHDKHKEDVRIRNGGKTPAQIEAELRAQRESSKWKKGLSPRAQELLRREDNK